MKVSESLPLSSGVVISHKLADESVRATVQLDWAPEGTAEKTAAVVGFGEVQVKADPQRFKQLIENNGDAVGWRGNIPRE